MKSPRPAKLVFMCGKMAAGKTTLSRELARTEDAVLLVQDDFLTTLYPGEIVDLSDFVRCSARLRKSLTPLIGALLAKGLVVVLDFPGNTRTQRAWFRTLFEQAAVAHELHFVDVSDAVCKHQLKHRSRDLPIGSAWTTEAEFDAVTAYFEAPRPEEDFHVIRHERP